MLLTKQQAVEIFGNQSAIARAIGVHRSAVSLWADQLTQRQTDELVGAATRLGIQLPEGFIIEQAKEPAAA